MAGQIFDILDFLSNLTGATDKPLVTPLPQRNGMSIVSGANIPPVSAPTAPPTALQQVVAQSMSQPAQQQIQQPMPLPSASPEIDGLVKQIWGNQAEDWYHAMEHENGSHDPKAEYTKNKDGSIDRGLMQINSNTFNDFMRRHGSELKAQGINNFDDMFDPTKNLIMGKLVHSEQGWNAWHAAPDYLKKR